MLSRYGRMAACIFILSCLTIQLVGCNSAHESTDQIRLPDLQQKQKHARTSAKHPELSLSMRNQISGSFKMTRNKGMTKQGQSGQSDQARRKIGRPRSPVRGIYVSGWIAGSSSRLKELIKLVGDTDLNAMVIDVKNDYGMMTYRSELREVREIGAGNQPAIADIRGLIKQLKSKHIYVIGRIVAFKDPLYARRKPSQALQKRSGGVWKDHQGNRWLNPFQPDVRSYNIAIAAEAAKLGFDEIQFDYVRFPDNGARVDREVSIDGRGKQGKGEIIGQFLREARKQIHQEGARLSADVYGLVTSYKEDLGIGQTWRSIATAVDVISPMTYPSHYSSGMYGVKKPDLQPHSIIRHAMMEAQQSNAILRENNLDTAKIRPWLQSFTAGWVHPHQRYGARQIRQQIQAAKEQGVNEFLLWSSNCRYDYRFEK